MSPTSDNNDDRGGVATPTEPLSPRQVWERASELEFASHGGLTALPLLSSRVPIPKKKRPAFAGRRAGDTIAGGVMGHKKRVR